MREWIDERSQSVQRRNDLSDKGATMRLGAYSCRIEEKTLAFEAYQQTEISERHRHRYEFNNEFMDQLKENGMVISGTSPSGELVEIIEVNDHPWFLGCQFHPEFKSRPMTPHPLFREFIKASLKKSESRNQPQD